MRAIRPWRCEACGEVVTDNDIEAFVTALTRHAREVHDWPYPDQAIRNFAEATQRATGPTERLDQLPGDVEIHRVTEEQLDDWATFFDRDAFADNFAWASCYCAEPFLGHGTRTWEDTRAAAQERLQDGRSVGYLAYVDGRAAGWVNASLRSEYALFESVDGSGDHSIGLSCFVIAPPYRGHGLARLLLERVIADAPERGAAWIEAYPFFDEVKAESGMPDFRGSRSMFESFDFDETGRTDRGWVMRRAVR